MKRLNSFPAAMVVTFLVVFLFFLTNQGQAQERCLSDFDCTFPEICLSGQCTLPPPPPCTVDCDCPQGQFCFKGSCVTDPKLVVYCCEKSGCPPGERCINSSGTIQRCAEDPNYECQSPCDCGLAHCCIADSSGIKRCVKDINDPWLPGGIQIITPGCQIGTDPTYCCEDSECHAAISAYGTNYDLFRCYNQETNSAEQFCGGKKCFYSGDCDPGESCVDTHAWPDPLLPPGTICNPDGGHCVSNAVAEAIYGYCAPYMTSGSCEVGWKQGGVYLVERVIGDAGSCGNGVCDDWEFGRTCAADCTICTVDGPDGRCEPEEFYLSVCLDDCGYCGDQSCNGWETPKNCPQDCPVVCGDGSCDPSEVTSCPQDCGCPESSTDMDISSICGDLYCDANIYSLENCVTCPQDCGPATDSDGDGTADCIDECPNDPNKTQTGICGCGVADADSDNDGIKDCNDNCPTVANLDQQDSDGDGIGDVCQSSSVLNLVLPNGGDIMPSGGAYAICWQAPLNAVMFDLYYSMNNGASWNFIKSVTGLSCTDWEIPVVTANKKKCRVKAIGYDSENVKLAEDISDKPFTIEVLRITSPNGGESFKSGDITTIQWTTHETIRPVAKTVLKYTTNRGASWTKIRAFTGNPGTYNWAVPNVSSTKCKVKVILKDASGINIGTDVSDKVFTIQP
jgi:hypothetical protein